LEQHQLTAAFMNTINDGLEQEGLLLKGGTRVDATLIHAAPSTKHRDKTRDPDLHQTQKGNQWFYTVSMSAGPSGTSTFMASAMRGNWDPRT